jgi:hypothetical protein
MVRRQGLDPPAEDALQAVMLVAGFEHEDLLRRTGSHVARRLEDRGLLKAPLFPPVPTAGMRLRIAAQP